MELHDGSHCDFIVSVTILLVAPYVPAFIWKHRFYRTVESAIQGAVVEWARKRTYAQLVRYENTGPSSEFFQRALSRLNVFGANEKNEGLLKGFGMLLVQGWIEVYQLSGKDLEIQSASKARELAERLDDAGVTAAEKAAEARRKQAAGERDGKKIEAEGEKERIKSVLEASGGSVDLAVQYFKIDQRKATPGLGTLIESDAKTGTVISIPAQTPVQPPTQKPPEGNPQLFTIINRPIQWTAV